MNYTLSNLDDYPNPNANINANTNANINANTATATATNTTNPMQKNQVKKSFYQNLINFLSGGVLPVFMGVAIGGCFKEMINSIVSNLIIPLIIKLLSISHLNNYYDFSSYLTKENNFVNIKIVTSNIFTFIFVTVFIYFFHEYIVNYSSLPSK
jgi:large-conductance mechanosensitive channel